MSHMTRFDRLMRTLRGESVDRPPVCFYEINGYDEHPQDPDPFNIYSHPSWKPLIDLAREHSDRILMCKVPFQGELPEALAPFTQVETRIVAAPASPPSVVTALAVSSPSSEKAPPSLPPSFVVAASAASSSSQNLTRLTVRTLQAGHRLLTERTRRDSLVNTDWVEEHLLKDIDDLQAYLTLPAPQFSGTPHIAPVLKAEAELGDTGIVMIDTPDPLCLAAALFDLGTFTVIALTEPQLFHRLLERFAAVLLPQTEAVARLLPGRLWRIYGPEYASPPYLPPRLFREYVVRYDRPMVEAIQRYGGYARVHCHGKIGAILEHIASTGCLGLDPIEPPPQGDVELSFVRQRYGEQMVLFGNLEASDLETLPPGQFALKIEQALRQGTQGKGRGFVLMPSSCPYGRVLSDTALRNYEKMVELASSW